MSLPLDCGNCLDEIFQKVDPGLVRIIDKEFWIINGYYLDSELKIAIVDASGRLT